MPVAINMVTDRVSNCFFLSSSSLFPIICYCLSRFSYFYYYNSISFISVYILVRILSCKIHSNYHYYHQSNFIFVLHALVQSRLLVGKALFSSDSNTCIKANSFSCRTFLFHKRKQILDSVICKMKRIIKIDDIYVYFRWTIWSNSWTIW